MTQLDTADRREVSGLSGPTTIRPTDKPPFYFWGLDTDLGVWALATIVGWVEPVDPHRMDHAVDTFGPPQEPAVFGAEPMPFTSEGRDLVWEIQPHWVLRSPATN